MIGRRQVHGRVQQKQLRKARRHHRDLSGQVDPLRAAQGNLRTSPRCVGRFADTGPVAVPGGLEHLLRTRQCVGVDRQLTVAAQQVEVGRSDLKLDVIINR